MSSSGQNAVAHNIPVAIPFNQLQRSANNMRTVHPKDCPADKQLIASVRVEGIIQNLIAVKKADDKYEVPAGGRRFGALEYLHKQGEIADDHPVYCIIIESSDALNISLVENFQRLSPHPADTYTAFVALIDSGETVKTIAIKYGISELEVHKFLRLGKVNKTLFKRFKKNDLSLDQMMAFASTADTKVQLAIFKASGENTALSPSVIRSRIAEGSLTDTAAIVQFIGLEAYDKAGGTSEKDLFTNQTVLSDTALITDLAEQKLNKVAESLKEQGWKWINTSMEGRHIVFNYQRLTGEPTDVPAEWQHELDEMEKQFDQLEAVSDEAWNDKLQDEYNILEERLDALRDKIDDECIQFSDAQKAISGAVVTFSADNGELVVLEGLMTTDDIKDQRASESAEHAESEPVVEGKPKSPELSQRLLSDMGIYRRAAISAELSKHPALAVDLLHFQICVRVLDNGLSAYNRILDISVNVTNHETSLGDYSETKAAQTLSDRLSKLDTSWLKPKSVTKRFEAFSSLSPNKKKVLVSYCAAQALFVGDELAGKNKLVEQLVDSMQLQFSWYWRPTAENYFSRVNTRFLLGLGKKLFGKAWFTSHENTSKKALVGEFDVFFNNTSNELDEKRVEIRDNWLPREISK